MRHCQAKGWRVPTWKELLKDRFREVDYYEGVASSPLHPPPHIMPTDADPCIQIPLNHSAPRPHESDMHDIEPTARASLLDGEYEGSENSKGRDSDQTSDTGRSSGAGMNLEPELEEKGSQEQEGQVEHKENRGKVDMAPAAHEMYVELDALHIPLAPAITRCVA